MEKQIILQKNIRYHFLSFLENYSIKELCCTPKGFNNNIFWNIAHVTATHQLLCYYLSDVPMKIDSFWVENFKKGTIPSVKIEKNHVSSLKQILINQPNEILEDYTDGVFKSFKTYETSFGTILNSIDDAIRFNNIHEGVHLGYIMAIRKLI